MQAYIGNGSEHLFSTASYAANNEHIQVRTDDKQRTVASSQALLLGLCDFDSKYRYIQSLMLQSLLLLLLQLLLVLWLRLRCAVTSVT
jgi:hypothetical protein